MSDENIPPSSEDESDNQGAAGPASAGRIVDLAIEQALADSYLTYSISTIGARAPPDLRDGLPPRPRRVLTATN